MPNIISLNWGSYVRFFISSRKDKGFTTDNTSENEWKIRHQKAVIKIPAVFDKITVKQTKQDDN